ncbi:hypothetical protein [Burkholderia gladioli]|uniref:hypothetical protein n=1 Tax=Burkholderia gladioli TaxID=28095 RepID=UPI0034DB381D
MSKVTEWYPASVKPVREGEYETRSDDDNCAPIIKRKFECGEWLVFDWISGYWIPSFFGSLRHSQWRGLAEKPA